MRKTRTLEERFMAKVSPCPITGCWWWTGGGHERGYGRIGRGRRDSGVASATHVALMIVGRPVPDGMFACHTCDNPACVNPAHLFAGTHIDNMRDMDAKGRRTIRCGESSPTSKLTEMQVRDMRSRFDRFDNAAIGRNFGVSKETVRKIRAGLLWSTVV